MKTVTVMAQPEKLKDGSDNPNAGKTLTIHEESGWGRIMVKSESFSFVNNVFRNDERYAFLSFPPETLEVAEKQFKAGMVLPGVIQKRQSPTPLYEGHEQAINPQTGEAMGYYLDYLFNEDQLAAPLIMVDHAQAALEREQAKNSAPELTRADIPA